MSNQNQSPLSKLVRTLLGNPWLACVVMAFLGTTGAWLTLQGSTLMAWNRIAVGTVFGLSLGLVYIVEAKYGGSTLAKRILAGIVGLLSGSIVALLLHYPPMQAALCAAVGLVLGFTARNWMWHVNLP